MTRHQSIMRVRRQYNQWVANETLEDFALRFTARRARRWSSWWVANTAIGSISFLALEAIGGALTLRYGFDNAVAAIMLGGLLLFLSGLPISYYAARYGVDIDLLTRGAGFGYIGSTITSLIYASFTFIFFALEAAILSLALELCFGLPLEIGYLLNALVVIPLVTHGFTKISRFQSWTQPLWAVLHVTPFIFLLVKGTDISPWTSHTGVLGSVGGGLDLLLLGVATGIVLSLIAQIGEQVDFLRFLPEKGVEAGSRAWWTALICAGPGWSVLGVLKMLAGSFLAILAFSDGVAPENAVEPTQMYLSAFQRVTETPTAALVLTGLFVIVSQLKINVTNAYAGSIAWSNFFSRLTHSHPGRVVWLVFNVLIALMLMEFGVFAALEHTLGLYSHVAVAWIGAIVADLIVNKPLGLSPAGIEFRRAQLYDINPVGVGAMLIATALALLAHLGMLGKTAQALSVFLALSCAFVASPLIAWATRGRYYIARPASELKPAAATHTCCICEYEFDADDMSHCPFYQGKICSLCCSLDARCHDACKPHATIPAQTVHLIDRFLPERAAAALKSKYGFFVCLLVGLMGFVALSLIFIYQQVAPRYPEVGGSLSQALWITFGILLIFAGVAVWLYVLAHESRRFAQEETERQTSLLRREIAAHARTDSELQRAKEQAEAANQAKSHYIIGISHELRSPLNAIFGYAQLLENDPDIPARRVGALRIVRQSTEHLAGLVEGLLDISKIEAGRLDIIRENVRIGAFLDQLADMFRIQAEAKGVAFRYSVSDRLPRLVQTDGKRLRQILINLLSNAIKFTDNGNVSFKVNYTGEVAEFVVGDTGRGIAPDHIERIFMPFERIHTPGVHQAPGTGLGLTITKLLTEVMGGELRVTSVPGKGSVFRVRLLLTTAFTSDTESKMRPQIFGYEGERRKIMVVDDNPDHRSLVTEALSPLGFIVFHAADGAACLETAKQLKPDLFILDISMPGLDGWALAKALREDGFAGTPVMMASASPAPRSGGDMVGAHHDDFISKPIKIEDLLDRIQHLLRIEWRTEPPDEAEKPVTLGMLRNGHRPTSEQIYALRHLAQIGYVRGIRENLDEIETANPELADFAAHLRELVSTYRLSEFDSVLEALQSDDAG